MFLCIKWQQHIFNSNIVPASNDGTMKHNFSLRSTGSTTLTCCVKQKFTNVWPRRPQQGFILPTNIRLHRHPHCHNSCKIFCQTPSVLTCRNCTVCHTVFMMLYAGHCITDNTCNNWSPIYLSLWMCLVRDSNSGLFIFLIQILIWSYSVAVIFQLYLAWIQDKETHTLPSNILTVFYSSIALHPACPFCAGSCPTNDMSDPFWQ